LAFMPLVWALLPLQLVGCTQGPQGKDTDPSQAAQPAGAAPGSAAGTTANLPPAPPEPPAPPMPVIRVLERGEGWRRVKVTGDAEDGVTGVVRRLGDEYTVIEGRAAINRTSLPAKTRQALAETMRRQPAPGQGDDEILIVPKRVAEVVDGGATRPASCHDEDRVLAKTYEVDRTYNYRKGSAGVFTGKADLNTRVKGSVTGQIKYSLKHASCSPFVVIRRVTLTGSTDVVADAAIDGTFRNAWNWTQEVYTPVLGSVTLPGIAIPVTFKAPITVGIDASGAAQLTASAHFEAHGYFNVHCNSGGCSGIRSATHGFSPVGTPSAAVGGQVKVTPWVEGGFRAAILDEASAHAQVGVRAELPTDLWAYAGNTCGDSDRNGSDEMVAAATIDLAITIDVVARAAFVGREAAPWYWTVWNRHLAFWSVGSGSAISPLFYAQSVDANGTVTMRAGMRPCWPYSDVVTYLVTWSDGATELVTGAPGTMLTLSHRFASLDPKLLRIDALSDAAGRTLGASTARNVSFRLTEGAQVAGGSKRGAGVGLASLD
jgi:hypothetical protein